MHGEHGEVGSLQKMQEALENARTEQAEIGLCKKNSEFLISLYQVLSPFLINLIF